MGEDEAPWDVHDLPVLGEPFAVEFANTLYESDVERIDVLEHPAATALWFRVAPDAADLEVPDALSPDRRAELRDLRDAFRRLLVVHDDAPAPPDADAVDLLNAAAGEAPAHVVLSRRPGTGWAWQMEHTGDREAALVAAIATRCITFLASGSVGRVRRCQRPGCPMLFVAAHRARRFCHSSCSHSVRQSRYYRSKLRDSPPGTGERDRPREAAGG